MVAEALRQLNSEKEMWHLERICEEVPCRGHAVDGLTAAQAECVVRCEVGDGMGQGFFVMKNSKVDQEKKALKEKKTQQNISTSINYALRAQQEHPGKHKKKIPLGKSY